MSNGVPCCAAGRNFFGISLSTVFLFTGYLFCILGASATAHSTPSMAEPTQTATISGPLEWLKPQQVSNGYLISFPVANADRNKLIFTSLKSGESNTVAFSFAGSILTVTGAAVLGTNRLAVIGAQHDKHVVRIEINRIRVVRGTGVRRMRSRVASGQGHKR